MPLTITDLEEIIRDLDPASLKRSHERLSKHCNDLNAQYNMYVGFRQLAAMDTPGELVIGWEKVERKAQQLQEAIQAVEFNIAFQIDTMCGRPDQLPSEQAREEARRIVDDTSLIVPIAQFAIRNESEKKDSTRKDNFWKHLLFVFVSRAYQEIFQREASACREGQWPTFLSRVLSKLENKDTSPNAAYMGWLKAKKWLTNANAPGVLTSQK